MIAVYVRLLIGFVLMAGACGLALRIGGRSVRRAAVLIAVCWAGSTGAEVVTGLQAEPVIAANVVCGLGLLGLAWLESSGWLWLLVGVEALMFLMHALLYRAHQPVTTLQIIANNGLAALALVVLVAAALTHRRGEES